MSFLKVFRIVKAKRSESAFSGEGAKLFGGRWHHQGYTAVYTSGSLSLAALEILVNLDEFPPKEIQYVSIAAVLPEKVAVQSMDSLPEGWDGVPAPIVTQEYGTDWIRSANTAVLRVPSAIIDSEYNYLLNPLHPDFKKIIIEDPQPFSFERFAHL